MSVRESWNLYRGPKETLAQRSNDAIAHKLLSHLCRTGMTFVDVGAHIGSVVNAVRHGSHPGAIIAFEAIPNKAERLRRLFPDIKVIATAVGEQAGTARFFIDLDQSGYSSLLEGRRGDARTQCIETTIQRIDDVIDDDRVDLIKIDVEGAELAVLRGASATIENNRPVIMFESGAEEAEGMSRSDLWSWFQSVGYGIFAPIHMAHNTPAMTQDVFLTAHFYPPVTTNYFAVPIERREEIRRRCRLILNLD